MIKLTLNNTSQTFAGDPDSPLIDYLRDEHRILSVKDGCSPQAACGCCAVELNGKIVLSCVIPMKKAANSKIRTLEGIDDRIRKTLADAFAHCGGAQCAFCIP
ncbi:hypothetical protein MNBD_PLANCTO03-1230, partial [hydrothermal vent metagenome]